MINLNFFLQIKVDFNQLFYGEDDFNHEQAVLSLISC